MPLDRQDLLRQADQSLRQGRLHDAIAAYARLVEDQPRDLATVNALGDLYVRAGDIERAVAQFTRIADSLFDEGFIPKAAALYKKSLKIKGTDQHTLLRLAEIAARQGLLAESKLYLRQLTEPPPGVTDAAPPSVASQTAPAASPSPAPLSADNENTDVLLAQAQLEMADEDLSAALATLTRLLAVAPERYREVVAIAEELIDSGRDEVAYRCIEVAVDAALLESAFERAATLLQTFIDRRRYAPALEKLIAVCAEAGYDDRRRVAEAELDLLRAFGDAPESAATLDSPAPPPSVDEEPEFDLTDLLDAVPDAGAGRGDMPSSAAESRDDAMAPPAGGAEGPRSLEQVFDDMRARAGDTGDEAARDYDAALLHLQNGRIAEAIDALQTAARTPRLRFQAAAQLGRVHLQQGNLQAAVDWFERAAEAPAPSPDEALAVLYALADTLERSREPARALAVFLEIAADADGFRDVPERIERLTRTRAGSASA